MKRSLRSPLARVRGLGSARSGTERWLWERLTSLALIPLSLWFVVSLVTVLRGASQEEVRMFFVSPANAVTMTLLMVLLLWHGMMGLQVILEDYMHRPKLHVGLIILNKFVAIVLIALSVMAIMKLHFFSFPPQMAP